MMSVIFLNSLWLATKISYFLLSDILKRFCIFIFREGRKREREISMHERYIYQLHLSCHQPGEPARDPDMCTDQELNRQPFGSQAHTKSTKWHQPGHKSLFLLYFSFIYLMTYFFNMFYWLCCYSCPISPPSLPSILHTLSHPHSPLPLPCW